MKTSTSLNSLKAIVRLASVLCVLLMGVENIWGTPKATYSWTATPATDKDKFSSTSGNATLGSYTWAYTQGSVRTNYASSNPSGYIQLGAKNNSIGAFTLTLTNTDPVVSVSVNCASYSGSSNISITIGDYEYLSSESTTIWNQDTGGGTHGGSTLSTPRTGDIQISFTASTRALYIKSITIVYGEAASCGSDPTVTAASSNGAVTSTSIPVQCASGISNIGGAGCSLTDYGFVWKTTSAAPDISTDTKQSLGSSIAASTAFNYTITGLTPNTKYYVYAYATNGHGTGYSSAYEVTTLQRYTISYNNNGGSGSMAGSTKDHGVAFALPANAGSMSKTGHHITGWLLNSGSGTHYDLGGSYEGNSNATFFAEWTANTYQVAFNNNGGSGSMSNETGFSYGVSKALTACSFTAPEHKYFIGWNTDKDASTALYADGASVSNLTTTDNGTVTLYAIWKDHTYTNYRTSCCTELGTIDGEASLTQAGNSVTISGWSDVSNVGTYTVKLYKKNGASWDLVSGTTSGGSAGAQGTRTGITSGSKSVTYTGLEVESEYKFTVQAIAGSAAYCDGAETAITEINSTDVSGTPFKFRYSIYIDNGSGSGWAHHYIEPTGNTDEGSVSIDLNAHVTSYEFKIYGGFTGNWGQTGSSAIPASTKWTLNGSFNVKLNTGAGGSYTFTVDYSGTTNPGVTVTFPSADQDPGYKIYFDKSVIAGWGNTLKYRVGNNTHNQNQNFTLVSGTDNFYVTTTPDYDSMDAWQIANNVAWVPGNPGEYDAAHGIYNYYHSGDANNITKATVYFDYAVDEDITIVPTSKKNTENECDFWYVAKTSGMLTHNAAISSYSHGTVTVAYTNTSGSAASFTSGNADLAHRCILTITATPATGYSLTSLTVGGNAFTSGDTIRLRSDISIVATFTAQTSTVTLQATNATSGSNQTVLASYDASMPLVTTAVGTPAVAAISRTGYTFNGWWDATSDGKQYYSYSAGTIGSANNWDKTGTQTLYAQWIAKQYTITLDREGADSGAESVTATYDAGTLAGWSAPSKTGYTFGGYWSGDNGTGTLVISTTGVLQNNVTISAVNWTDASGHWIKDDGAALYAKWTADEYTISYKDQGNVAYSGSNSALLPTTHTYGAATDLVDGVKSGYRFDGWFDNSSCTGSAITTIGATAITANTTYYAKWTEVYTVTWHVNGEEWTDGVVTGNSQVVSGEKISDVPTAPADNTLNNCANKFMGWSSKNATSTPKTTSYYDDLFTTQGNSPTISGNTDFYAVFAEEDGASVNTLMWKEYWTGYADDAEPSGPNTGVGYEAAKYGSATISYRWEDGTTSSAGTSEVSTDNGGNLAGGSSPEAKIGKKGSGGSAVGGYLQVSGIPNGGADSLTLTYKQNANSLTASISGTGYTLRNGNSDVTSVSNSSKGTYSYAIACGSASTFTLKFQAAGNNVRLDDIEVKVRTVSYSNYVTECAANQVRVTYDFNGGSGTACSEGVTTTTASYTVCSTTPTKDYYDFAGWNDGTSTYNAGATGYNLASSTTFTAQWTPTTYDITYELDGGTNDGDNPATYNVTTETITLEAPTRDHDRFDGWFTDDGVWSDEVTEIPLGSHGDITLYAKWAERYEIVFDADGTETTIYRASDENMGDAVAGQGSKPSNPSAPSACSSKVFVGWSESEIDDETDTRPGDLTNATGTVSADKHYYAVWATQASTSGPVTVFEDALYGKAANNTTFDTYGDWDSFGYVYGCGTSTEGVRVSSQDYGGHLQLKANIGLASVDTIKFKIKSYGDANGGKITLSSYSGAGTYDNGSSAVFTTTNTSSWEEKTCILRSADNTTDIRFEGEGSKYRIYLKDIKITKAGTVYTYSAYATSCCATNVTLSQNSPSNGTIEFGKTKVGTCGDKEVSLTITPAAGYQLHTYEVATGSGKVATKSVSPAISLDNNSSAAQNITLTFADEANGAYDVTASFSLMTVTSWTWTMHDGGGAIPDPLNLYVGQSARLDVAYTPSGVDGSKKTYTRDRDADYINFGGGSYVNYTTVIGRASTGDNTTAVTFTHADGPTKTVNVKVLPLPLTHFEDLVHGKSFDDVVATIADNALSATKTTPTSDDWTTPNANECEENHLHLVGWIREDWPALVAYLAGTGDAPTTTAIVGAGNDGSGNAYFFAPNASINVQTFDGVTFYAVWAEIK